MNGKDIAEVLARTGKLTKDHTNRLVRGLTGKLAKELAKEQTENITGKHATKNEAVANIGDDKSETSSGSLTHDDSHHGTHLVTDATPGVIAASLHQEDKTGTWVPVD